MEDIYDVLILGGGPGGLTAAIYCGRYNLKTLVVAGNFGGTANLAGEVENWPGERMISGIELMNKIKKQAEEFGAEFLETEFESVEIEDETTNYTNAHESKEQDKKGSKDKGIGQLKQNSTRIHADSRRFVLHAGEKKIYGKSLIVALGTEHRQLNVPGEKEFLGRGVSYCATCDGNFFRKKKVAVVGGANSAAKAALYLADICEKVYVVYRKHEMRCEPVSLEKLKKLANVEILYHSNPVEIYGENVVKGMRIEQGKAEGSGQKAEIDLEVSGVFIEVGSTPASDVLAGLGLKMNEKGYVVVGKDMATSVEGVWAAGDVTDGVMKQMITAAGDGAVAGKGVHEFLMKG